MPFQSGDAFPSQMLWRSKWRCSHSSFTLELRDCLCQTTMGAGSRLLVGAQEGLQGGLGVAQGREEMGP